MFLDAHRQRQSKAETAPGVASELARALVRREVGSEFQALGPAELKERSLTVFNFKSGTAKVGMSEDLNARIGTKSFHD